MQNIQLETTPTDTPQSGSIYIYPKSDNYLYSKDSAGNEKKIGGDTITLTTEYPLTGGTSQGTIGLSSTTIGATKTKITYDSRGLVVTGTTLLNSDVPILNEASTGYLKNTNGTLAWTSIPTLEEPVNYAVLEGIPSPNNAGVYDGQATTTWTKLRRNFINAHNITVLNLNPFVHRNVEIITDLNSTGTAINITGGTADRSNSFYFDGCTMTILLHVASSNNDKLYTLGVPSLGYKNGSFANLSDGVHLIRVYFFGGCSYWKIEYYG